MKTAIQKQTSSTPARGQLRLLFLLPFAPRLDAAHGGGRVIAEFLSEIGCRHKIAIVYFRGENEPPLDEHLQERCDIAVEVARPWSGDSAVQRWFRGIRLFTSLFRLRPMWATDWASRAFGQQVRSVSRTWRPDIVQIEYHVLGQYLPFLCDASAPKLLVEHEPGTRAAPYLKDIPSIINRFIHQMDKLAWHSFETEILRNVQAIVVFTDRDKKSLASLRVKTPVYTIPFGTEIPVAPLNPLGCSPMSLLFVGNFMHPPNVKAAIRLTRNIFSSLQKRYPELMLYIVGDQPPPDLKKLSGENVVITGRVPDLAPYLDRAAVFVAPLYSGGGMRVKVLEALAAGKAIVATPLSIEGLDLKDGVQILLAVNDTEMIDRIDQLLANPGRRTALAKRARSWACANLSWEKTIETYEALYQTIRLA